MMSNNVIRFPSQHPAVPQNGHAQFNPMQMIMSQFMSGMSPSSILDRIRGEQAMQAKKLISGKNEDQLRQIAANMAAQRGIDLNQLAQQMGIRLPK